MVGEAKMAEFGWSSRCDPNGPGRPGAIRARTRGLRRLLGRRLDTPAERLRASEPASAAQCEAPEYTGAAATQFLRQRGTQIVTASGDLRDTRVLQSFHRRCKQALSPGRQRGAVDLGRATDADSKLIATLVVIHRWTQAQGVCLDLSVPDRLRAWIALCQVDRLLYAGAGGCAPTKRARFRRWTAGSRVCR
jgi:ABC-type transporter Mla MlaB component